ncbi:MAG: signal peptidase I [bacterium]
MKEKPKLNQLKSWIFDWGETLIVALVLALVIRAFFLQVFWIPSCSMEPTLNINDRIVVNKVIYYFRAPKRFEIMVFRGVGEPKKDLIKRIVGLPGEKLELKKGVLYINDQQITETHQINQDNVNYGPVQIPNDSYFMMGDNRPFSADSRYFGFLPKKNIIGPAILRIWPLTKIGLI